MCTLLGILEKGKCVKSHGMFKKMWFVRAATNIYEYQFVQFPKQALTLEVLDLIFHLMTQFENSQIGE